MTRALSRTGRVCLQRLACEASARQGAAFAVAARAQRFSTSTEAHHAYAAAVASSSIARAPTDIAPATRPPSARPVDTRKSQLIRTYTSLLRTTPLMLFFQHNNVTAVEWAAVKRELKKALAAVLPAPSASGSPGAQPLDLAPHMQIQVLRTNMLKVAFKISEFFDPEAAAALPSTPRTSRGPLTHDLSLAAYEQVKAADISSNSAFAQVEPLLMGPVAALLMPAVSPAHLAAALSVLAPVPGKFPAPTRKKNPGYHDPICQNGLAKLLLVGGRIEGKVFDQGGVNWVGGIEGGLDGLRAQLVAILQGAGLGLTTAIGGGSRNVWLTLEGRRLQLDEEANPKTDSPEGSP
ncbi:hypothetical protein ESCO_001894 [Escovopsis weberi]|uniref:54S ribosomal protein L11 n=1 Tax=Escovopsis weberi TaxID=150374 RepID=A0A0M8N0E7_ESCWE|nr:hypothetical protein ESCO_001894 [Escovopsis weberi]